MTTVPMMPRLVCVLCGQMIMEPDWDNAPPDLDWWPGADPTAQCSANAAGPHFDPKKMTGIEVEAVLAMRRKWLNP